MEVARCLFSFCLISLSFWLSISEPRMVDLPNDGGELRNTPAHAVPLASTHQRPENQKGKPGRPFVGACDEGSWWTSRKEAQGGNPPFCSAPLQLYEKEEEKKGGGGVARSAKYIAAQRENIHQNTKAPPRTREHPPKTRKHTKKCENTHQKRENTPPNREKIPKLLLRLRAKINSPRLEINVFPSSTLKGAPSPGIAALKEVPPGVRLASARRNQARRC